MSSYQQILDDPQGQWRRMPTIGLPYLGTTNTRSAFNVTHVVDQFHVERSARYQPRDGKTFCATFAWDVTSALGCEIPHWVDLAGNVSAPSEDKTVSREINANEWADMLAAGAWGWSEVTEVQAFERANAGFPTVAIWQNPDPAHHGHVALVEPLPPRPGLFVAMAGLQCGRLLTLRDAFGLDKHPERVVRFYTHA